MTLKLVHMTYIYIVYFIHMTYIYVVYLDVRLLGQSTFHPSVQKMQIHPQSFIQPQKQRLVNNKKIVL